MLVLGLGLGLGPSCSRSEPQAPPTVSSSTRATATVDCAERLLIDVAWPGASAIELEQQVVVVIESAIAPLHGIEQVSSTIADGRATVWVQASSDTLPGLRTELRAKLAGLDALPEDVEPPMLSIVAPPRPAQVVLSRGPTDQVLTPAVDELERALVAAPGVTRVQRRGQRAWGLSIEADPARLLALGIELSTITTAVRRTLHEGDPMLIRAPMVADLDGLGRTQVATLAGTPVLLHDVAVLRLEPDRDGPRAWAGDASVQVLLVESDDPRTVARVLAETPIPTGVTHAIEGRLVPRGCVAPGSGVELDGDFELLELGLAPDAGEPRTDALARDAPRIDDAIWLVADPLLGDDGSPSASRLQLLLPARSPRRAELLGWVERTPGLSMQGDYGPERSHIVVELGHSDASVLEAAAARLIELTGERTLVASASPAMAPQLEINIQREEAARLGVSIHEISSHMRRAVEGEALGFVEDGGRKVPVRLAPGSPDGPGDPARRLSSILLPTPSGATVPLAAVAELHTVMQPVQLARRELQRVRHVTVWVALDARQTALRTLDEDVLPALGVAYPDLRVQHEP